MAILFKKQHDELEAGCQKHIACYLILAFISTAALALSIQGIPVSAADSADFENLKQRVHLTESIQRSFDFNYFPAYEIAAVKWDFDGEGQIKDIEMARSSTDPVVDLACIEAVCSNISVCVIDSNADPDCRACAFSADHLWKTKSAKVMFLEKHPQIADKVVLIYLVPLSIVGKYPRQFTLDELRMMGNVRLLMTDFDSSSKIKFMVAKGRLIQIFNDWGKFYKMNQKATRKDILAEANRIAKAYNLKTIGANWN